MYRSGQPVSNGIGTPFALPRASTGSFPFESLKNGPFRWRTPGIPSFRWVLLGALMRPRTAGVHEPTCRVTSTVSTWPAERLRQRVPVLFPP